MTIVYDEVHLPIHVSNSLNRCIYPHTHTHFFVNSDCWILKICLKSFHVKDLVHYFRPESQRRRILFVPFPSDSFVGCCQQNLNQISVLFLYASHNVTIILFGSSGISGFMSFSKKYLTCKYLNRSEFSKSKSQSFGSYPLL